MPGESYHTIHSTGDWTWLCDIFQKLVRLRLVRLRDWPLWNVFSPTATTVCTSDQITINWALDFVLNVLKSKLLHKYIVSCLKYGPVNHDLLWQVMSLDTCTNNFSDEVTEVSCLAWCWPLALYKIGRYFVLALDLGLPCVSVFFSSIVWCNIFQYVGCVDISFTFHGAFLSISLSVCWTSVWCYTDFSVYWVCRHQFDAAVFNLSGVWASVSCSTLQSITVPGAWVSVSIIHAAFCNLSGVWALVSCNILQSVRCVGVSFMPHF